MTGVAETRFRQIATFAVGILMLASGVADFPAITAQAHWLAPWWWYPAVVLNAGTALAFVILPWISVRMLRPVALVYALGSLVVLITIPFAGSLPDDLGSAWALRLISTYAIVAALALPARRVWAYIAVLMVVSLVSAWADSGDLLVALATDLVNLSVAVPLGLIMLAILRTGRALDAASASTIEAVRRDAAVSAAALERRRVELLAHDDILFTLRATALGFPTESLARTSLERLSQVDGPSTADLVTRLRSLTAQLAPEATFSTSGAGDLSPEVADALVEATGEALRNSVLHGQGSDIRVAAEFTSASARVSVADDGPGFRPSRLPAGRLGVSRSIVERMRSVTGGTARIRSAPGRGTTVELEWAA